MKAKQKKLHAWYSKKATKYGTHFYKNEAGKKIEVTFVSNNKGWGDKNYRWDDKEYLGLVLEGTWSGGSRPRQ
jgi:hypothetical protein